MKHVNFFLVLRPICIIGLHIFKNNWWKCFAVTFSIKCYYESAINNNLFTNINNNMNILGDHFLILKYKNYLKSIPSPEEY